MQRPSSKKIVSPTENELPRRGFLVGASTACATAALFSLFGEAAGVIHGPRKAGLCLFSKCLPQTEPRRLAQNAKRAGFDGIDLTVRKGGHVLPENASRDLPQAVAAIREEGLEVPMITTELVSVQDPTAEPILTTAGKLSIPYYKPGYYKYELVDVRRELEMAGNEFRQLVNLAQKCEMQTGYHNHVGYVGAPVWDMASIIEPMNQKWVGYYFDPRHAVAEGGVIGWKVALNLVAQRLKMVAIKDFYWEKSPQRGWQQIECPLGEGMVDWAHFFRTLARTGFQGPFSLHLEYEIPGRTRVEKEDNTLAAAQRDVTFLEAQVEKAYRQARVPSSS